MSMSGGLRALSSVRRLQNAVTLDTVTAAGIPVAGAESVETAARKLSAVDRCMEILSDSIGKLPNYVLDATTRNRVSHHLLQILNIRPNEAMTPLIRKKVLELSRLEGGNAYDWIIRDPRTGRVKELIPIPWRLVTPWRDTAGRVWYTVLHPVTATPMVLSNQDICHYKAASRDGLKGISVLQRASEVIASGRAAQQYDLAYYSNGGNPGGILQTATDLQGYAKDKNGAVIKALDGTPVSLKDNIRAEWEKIHAGANNAHRIAILDLGLSYQPLGSTNRDAQFVENKEVSVKDIARFFGVPLYKLQEGKQAYGSNEQNAIDYVVSTLHPIVCQYEEEQSYKLLTDTELSAGLDLRINLMAELKGDTASRSAWYRTMREIGGFTANDIRGLEDMPDAEGGDDLYASLNFVPLSAWKRLCENRNEGSKGNASDA